MPDVNLLAVLVAGVAMLVIGGVYYGLLGSHVAAVGEPRPGWQVPVVELLRGLVLAAVVAGLAAYAGIGTAAGGLVLGLVLWVGFPTVLWTGAVFHERVPVRQAAVHAGDWLAKLLVAGVIVAVWQ
jgi:Protein of unknown function (DUF1761)